MDCIKFLKFLIEKTKEQIIWKINNHFKMIFNILDKMVKSRFLMKDQNQSLIFMKYSLKEKENHLLKKLEFVL